MSDDMRQLVLSFYRQGNSYVLKLTPDQDMDDVSPLLSEVYLPVKVIYPDGWEKIYPVFAQNAMDYGDYSDYMRLHGCACCSLTTVLCALRRTRKQLFPQDTITSVEKEYISSWEYEKNYGKPLSRQMPISLYGISRILEQEKIKNRYIGSFKRSTAMEVIDRHLSSANPVIFETSRIRYKNGLPVRVNDRKYAGSYHTMLMLGYAEDKQVIFTDSATRSWAGERQRLKKAPLSELLDYMYPQKNTQDTHSYFSGRRNTGGFILVYAFSETPEWNLRPQ